MRQIYYLFGTFIICFVLFVYIFIKIISRVNYVNKFKGKTVLITGAGGGIGRELSLVFAKKESNLILWDINRSALDETIEYVNNNIEETKMVGIEAETVNISKLDIVKKAIENLDDTPDYVINNAGIVSGKLFKDLSEIEIRRTFDVNTFGPMWLVKSLLPKVIEEDKNIHFVTIASTMALFPAVGLTDYCASKSALYNFHDSLRLEIKQMGKSDQIKLTMICPNAVKTDMFKGISIHFQWIIPMLTPVSVAKSVLNAVEYNKKIVILPRSVALSTPIVKGFFPMKLKDFCMDLFGASDGMLTFVGRKDKSKNNEESLNDQEKKFDQKLKKRKNNNNND